MKTPLAIAAITLTLIASACSGRSDVERNIVDRPTVEQFNPDKTVSTDQIATLLQAANAAENFREVNVKRYTVLMPSEMYRIRKVLGDDFGATAAIIVMGNRARFGNGAMRNNWAVDCAAATQNIVTAATMMGLDSKWIRLYPVEALMNRMTAALNPPVGVRPFAVVLLGEALTDSVPDVAVPAARILGE